MHILHLSLTLVAWLDSTSFSPSLVFIPQEMVYVNLFYYGIRLGQQCAASHLLRFSSYWGTVNHLLVIIYPHLNRNRIEIRKTHSTARWNLGPAGIWTIKLIKNWEILLSFTSPTTFWRCLYSRHWRWQCQWNKLNLKFNLAHFRRFTLQVMDTASHEAKYNAHLHLDSHSVVIVTCVFYLHGKCSISRTIYLLKMG